MKARKDKATLKSHDECGVEMGPDCSVFFLTYPHRDFLFARKFIEGIQGKGLCETSLGKSVYGLRTFLGISPRS